MTAEAFRAFLARGRWSARLTWARAANRVYDRAGRAAGFCMATTWQDSRATYAPGKKDWRCWTLRADHGRWHRMGSYVWQDGQPTIYRPLPGGVLFDRVRPGVAPRWLRSKHHAVGTRRRDRLAVRAAFARIQAARQGETAVNRAARLSAQPGITFDPSKVHPPLPDAGQILANMRAFLDASQTNWPRAEHLREVKWKRSPDGGYRDTMPDGTARNDIRPYLPPPPVTLSPVVLSHAFTPGPEGTHLNVYCQAPAEPGAGPIAGAPYGPVCGWPEFRHPTPERAAAIEADEVTAVVAELYGETDSTKDGDQ